jgi:hypothetical protein
MRNFEVSNSKSAHVFGVYQAGTAEAAIEAACLEAGYNSRANAEEAMGRESQLVAVEVEAWEAWEDGGERVKFFAAMGGTLDIAQAGAAALGVDVTEALNVERV